MATHLLLLLALSQPDPAASEVRALHFAVQRWTANQIRHASQDVLSRTRDISTFDAPRDVPDLLMLRQAVLASVELSPREQNSQQRQIDYALRKSVERLRRLQDRLAKEVGGFATVKPDAFADVSLGGSSAQLAQAQQLIQLIEATIQPESWVNQGGRGTISYWAPGYALVIRNTQAVHEEIGGLLRTLEAQQR